MINNLLNQITDIRKNEEQKLKDSGENFNVFEILNKSHDEVAVCRVIAELISPNGLHSQGILFLKLFLINVLHIELSDEQINKIKVTKEYSADNRRIDIVLESDELFIPIEVKVYAGTSNNQLSDYYNYMIKQNKSIKSNLYYLTRDGDNPPTHSVTGLKYDKETGVYDGIASISFKDNILTWLNECLTVIELPSINQIVKQFIDIINKFTNTKGKEQYMEITKVITKSKENVKSAHDIIGSFQQVQNDFINKFFKVVEEKVSKLCNVKKINDEYDYEKKNRYYGKSRTRCPGISFPYINQENVYINVRVEIDHRVLVGYHCPEQKQKTATFDKYLPEEYKGKKSTSWWAFWEHQININDVPNFKHPNESYFDLFDDDIFDKYTSQVANRLKELLETK